MTYHIGQTLPWAPITLTRGTDPRWHCLLAYPQAESKARAWLDRKGLEAFYPVETIQRPRKPAYERRYLPGFVFARFPGDVLWHELFRVCPFVHDVLRFRSGIPGRIRASDLTSIMAMRSVDQAQAAEQQARKRIFKGARVRITEGPMEGFESEVVEIRAGRAKLTITLFGRETEADMALGMMERLENNS